MSVSFFLPFFVCFHHPFPALLFSLRQKRRSTCDEEEGEIKTVRIVIGNLDGGEEPASISFKRKLIPVLSGTCFGLGIDSVITLKKGSSRRPM